MPNPRLESLAGLFARAEERRELRPSALEEEVAALFDQLRERLLRYLLGFRLPIQDCEEVLQEVFLALFQHLQRGKSRQNLVGWLFRVAHNLALKRRAAGDVAGSMEGLEEVVADPGSSPEDLMADSQEHSRFQAILRVLPERDQCCLRLRAEGLRYREIAAVLNMSLAGVSVSLTRSLARLAGGER